MRSPIWEGGGGLAGVFACEVGGGGTNLSMTLHFEYLDALDESGTGVVDALKHRLHGEIAFVSSIAR